MAETAGYLLFSCGVRLYAVPANAASEVVIMSSATPVPGAPRHVLGIFSHRGEVLPVVDLARLLGLPDETCRRAVLVRTSAGPVVLTATKVYGLCTIEGAFEPMAQVGPQRHMSGPAMTAEGDAAIIDPQAIVEFLAAS